jgi:hypothetical protein
MQKIISIIILISILINSVLFWIVQRKSIEKWTTAELYPNKDSYPVFYGAMVKTLPNNVIVPAWYSLSNNVITNKISTGCYNNDSLQSNGFKKVDTSKKGDNCLYLGAVKTNGHTVTLYSSDKCDSKGESLVISKDGKDSTSLDAVLKNGDPWSFKVKSIKIS